LEDVEADRKLSLGEFEQARNFSKIGENLHFGNLAKIRGKREGRER
jgi:hypothetical protein